MIDPLSRWLHHRSPPRGALILMYHSVQRHARPRWPYAVTLGRFEAQLDFLQDEGYATPTIRELVTSPHQFTGRVAAITFDDGYVDNLDAWEALQRRGMKATWFVTAGYLGVSPPWREAGQPDGRLLSADELRQMVRSGMEVGSHTLTHPSLPSVDEATAEREILLSRSMLEEVTGTPVDSFAYPFGRWDERCEALVKRAGYRAACLTRTGWALREHDVFRLRRLTVFNDDTLGRFARKLAWATHDIGWRHVAAQAVARLAARVR